MEADWEVEVGGGAPVIDALWPGFVDLRALPERVAEISEAAAFPPLAILLCALNGPDSPVWTTKCDMWKLEPPAQFSTPGAGSSEEVHPALACYIDVLPREGPVFAHWQHAEAACRQWVAHLAAVLIPECSINLVVRQAIAGEAEGFGVTAYISAGSGSDCPAADALAVALAALADAILNSAAPAAPASKLQWNCVGE